MWDGHVHTAIFKTENRQGPAVERTELANVMRSLDGRGVWGRADACIFRAVPPCCPPETITVLAMIQCEGKSLRKTIKKMLHCCVQTGVKSTLKSVSSLQQHYITA